jgi:hypothetical protein
LKSNLCVSCLTPCLACCSLLFHYVSHSWHSWHSRSTGTSRSSCHPCRLDTVTLEDVCWRMLTYAGWQKQE